MYGLKTASDGTLQTTLGKKLHKSIKVRALDIKDEPMLLGTGFKELTFAIVPNNISLYIDEIKEDKRLTITDKCSIECLSIAIFVQCDDSINDDEMFEIWLWK